MSDQGVQPSLHVGKFVPNMVDQDLHRKIKNPLAERKHIKNLIQGLCKVLGATFVCDISVSRMIPEELGLALQGVRHGLLWVDILLAAIYYSDKTQLQRVDASSKYV